MSSGDDQLHRLTDTLETSARQIDLTFAQAGDRLGEGLTLFEGLKERLSVLSGELAGSDFAQATISLAGLASELRLLGEHLSGEIGALQELAMHSTAVSQALERLLGHMRLITILARSARIEAVSIQSTERDFGAFTGEIVTLTTQAQRTVEACARDHERLGVLLSSALAAQHDFERRYARALTDLAGKLELTLAEVAARQRKSLALTSDAAVHSGKIAIAAGGAIIALQSGDSIRQRLEHAIAALRIASATWDRAGPWGALNESQRLAGGFILRRLQAAQLRESATTLAGDADTIEVVLALLAGDTAKLIDLVRLLYGGDGADSASFLEKLEAELAEASELLGKCDAARASVDSVTDALSAVLDTCQRTVSTLSETVSNIVLIGMNAGLRASRLGGGGRSLIVIAQELKFAADQIATDTRRLSPTFVQMQMASVGLKRDGRLDAARFAGLDRAMRISLFAMRRTGERLSAALDRLTLESNGFCAVVAEARLSFSNTGALSDLIASAAEQLSRSASGETALDTYAAECVREVLQEHVWPNYTMAVERTIHLTVIEECGIVAERAQVLPSAPGNAAELDEFIF